MDLSTTKPLIIDGKSFADLMQSKIKIEVDNLRSKNKRVPGLGVILVGDNLASTTYVRNKENTSKKLGFYSEGLKLPKDTKENEIINQIHALNKNTNIDGILIQLPLPPHLKPENIIEAIDPRKDVDGLHPINLGKLFMGEQLLEPCTPQGIIELLKHYSINLKGSNVVIIGRSILVGKPLALLLLREDASVTIVHSKTKNIQDITKKADILIAAIGKPKFITKEWIKENSVIIDVGINQITESGKNKLVGDVDFEGVKPYVRAITPVPGGIGPVTVAMLMKNTLEAYKRRTEVY